MRERSSGQPAPEAPLPEHAVELDPTGRPAPRPGDVETPENPIPERYL